MGGQPERLFTIEECRRLLPTLRRWLEELRVLKSSLDEAGFDVFRGAFMEGRCPNGTGSLPEDYPRFVEVARRFVEAGVQLKSIEDGIVDFPARRANGETVCLCWQDNERTVSWWHSPETGWSGRRPIEEF